MSYSYIYQSAQKITLGWGDEAKEIPFGGLTWSGHFSGVAAYEGALDRVAVLVKLPYLISVGNTSSPTRLARARWRWS